jgi:hypothetical protein
VQLRVIHINDLVTVGMPLDVHHLLSELAFHGRPWQMSNNDDLHHLGLIWEKDFWESTSREPKSEWVDISSGGGRYVGDYLTPFGRHGNGTMTQKCGNIYTGEWYNDAMNGKGTMQYKNCKIIGDAEMRSHASSNFATYVGDWVNMVRSGRGVMSWEILPEDKDSDVKYWQYDGDWRGDVMHGHGTITYAGGRKFECDWSNNKCLPSTIKDIQRSRVDR